MDIREAVVAEITRLNRVLKVLDGGSVSSSGVSAPGKGSGKTRKRRKMSKAARAKIAAAQRARWAKAKKAA
jgi:hypothetical protein